MGSACCNIVINAPTAELLQLWLDVRVDMFQEACDRLAGSETQLSAIAARFNFGNMNMWHPGQMV